MRAWIVREHGGLDALRQEDIETPQPGPGEVAVRVEACGVNHLDLWVRGGVPGAKFPLPLIPGSDVAGVVVEMGEGVEDLRGGEHVVVLPGVSCGVCRACVSGRDHQCRDYGILGEHQDGGYAERIVVPRANIGPKPRHLSFAEAAAIGIPFLTAWHMLVDRAQLRPGEWVLVQAAGSGVSSAAIQIARMWGAKVIATSSQETKRARARELGADHVFDYRDENTAKEVKKLTGGGAAVVIDHVGEATWKQSNRALARHGRLVTCGATTGSEVSIELKHVFFKSQSILGSTMGSKGEMLELLSHFEDGALRPVLDREISFDDAREAHRLLAEREVFGKVVLIR